MMQTKWGHCLVSSHIPDVFGPIETQITTKNANNVLERSIKQHIAELVFVVLLKLPFR